MRRVRRGIVGLQRVRKYSSNNGTYKNQVAAVIIGDEILTGKVKDANTNELAQFLWNRGTKLSRVETITDSIEDIKNTIQRLGKDYQYIITTGGIGPTHDDLTYEGIAAAYNLKLYYHQPTLDALTLSSNAKGLSVTEARKRMAYIPETSEVVTGLQGMWTPLCIVNNQCFIFPGVPSMFKSMIWGYADKMPLGKRSNYRELVGTGLWEGDLAEELNTIIKHYPDLQFGSYPLSYIANPDSTTINVVISIEGDNDQHVQSAKQWAMKSFKGVRMSDFTKRHPLQN